MLLAVITVNANHDVSIPDNETTLREAIGQANAWPSPDRIEFDLPGAPVIRLSQPASLTINSDVEIVGPEDGAGVTIGLVETETPAIRLFTILQGSNVQISNLTITDGNLSGDDGAGIWNAGVLTLDGVTLTSNFASGDAQNEAHGGGIYNATSGNLHLKDTNVSANFASHDGGGIYNAGMLTVEESTTISENKADGNGGGVYNRGGTLNIIDSAIGHVGANQPGLPANTAQGNGGAIYSTDHFEDGSVVDQAEAYLTDSIVAGNEANDGGGIYIHSGMATFTGSHVDANKADFSGAGLFVGSSAELEIANTRITRNERDNDQSIGGGGGAGIYIEGGKVTITDNSEVSNNHALDSPAGGIFNNYGDLTLQDSTVENNDTMSEVGGIQNVGGMLTVTDSTIAGNEDLGPTGVAGGVYNLAGVVRISRSTISGNTSGGGSGIFDEPIVQAGGILHLQPAPPDEEITTLTETLQPHQPTLKVDDASVFDMLSLPRTILVISQDPLTAEQMIVTDVDSNPGTLTVVRNVCGEQAVQHDLGAQVFLLGDLDVHNSTLSGNNSSVASGISGGGGIFVGPTVKVCSHVDQQTLLVPRIQDSTIYRNEADTGGGVYAVGDDVFLENTIVAENVSPGSPDFRPPQFVDDVFSVSGRFTSGGHNLIGNLFASAMEDDDVHKTELSNSVTVSETTITVQDDSRFPGTAPFKIRVGSGVFPEEMWVTSRSGPTFTVQRGVDGTQATAHVSGTPVTVSTNGFWQLGDKHGTVSKTIRLNPRLGPLNNYGGPTATHRPLDDSPTIDYGDTLATVDQRGVPRPQDGPGGGGLADDMGAVEVIGAPAPLGIDDSADRNAYDHINDGSNNRSGIANLRLRFDRPVTVNGADSLRIFNHTTNTPLDISSAKLQNNGTTQVTWNFYSEMNEPVVIFPDGYYTAELPFNEAFSGEGKPLRATHTVLFHVLVGDSSGNAQVDFADFIDLTENFNTINGPIYGPGDMDGNGDVDISDFIELTNHFNNILSLPPMDFGDAPESATSYPTILMNNGARHIHDAGLFLGSTVDFEWDGQPDPNAAGDGGDENGVVFGTLEADTSATITVTATVPGGQTAVLNAWIDFNGDGDWDDTDGDWDHTGEHVFVDEPLCNAPSCNGQTVLTLSIPPGALAGETFARFRVTRTPGYSYFGLAPNGEVEDYKVIISNSSSQAAA